MALWANRKATNNPYWQANEDQRQNIAVQP